MPSPDLDRLVAIGQLKVEPPIQDEMDGLIRNRTEYQGFAEVDETLLENLIEITGVLLDKVQAER